MRPTYFLLLSILSLIGSGCQEDSTSGHFSKAGEFELQVPEGFPQPAIPDDNQLTYARVELGKKLFYDKSLSLDSTISCASCHFPEKAFTDPRPVSIGVDGKKGIRNSISLANVTYQNEFFRDGGAHTIEMQVAAPLEDTNEMATGILALIERLESNETYQKMAQEAYGRKMDAFVLTRAIGAFQRTLISGNSPYDQYINGDSTALNPSEKRGMKLFFGDKTKCAECHSGFMLTDFTYRNIGLYKSYKDTGRARITTLSQDVGKFRVPSLRNIALTGPYMHDGSVKTLEEVVEIYMEGGKGHRNQDPLIQPFHLTAIEQKDLINFMNSLTDSTFLINKAFVYSE